MKEALYKKNQTFFGWDIVKLKERNDKIVKEYLSGEFPTISLAKKYGVTRRTILRVVKEYNVSRTVSESNKLMAQLRDYSDLKLPPHIQKLRQALPQLTRKFFLQNNPHCYLCNILRGHGSRMEVTFKDGNTANTKLNNLATICRRCLAKQK